MGDLLSCDTLGTETLASVSVLVMLTLERDDGAHSEILRIGWQFGVLENICSLYTLRVQNKFIYVGPVEMALFNEE